MFGYHLVHGCYKLSISDSSLYFLSSYNSKLFLFCIVFKNICLSKRVTEPGKDKHRKISHPPTGSLPTWPELSQTEAGARSRELPRSPAWKAGHNQVFFHCFYQAISTELDGKQNSQNMSQFPVSQEGGFICYATIWTQVFLLIAKHLLSS